MSSPDLPHSYEELVSRLQSLERERDARRRLQRRILGGLVLAVAIAPFAANALSPVPNQFGTGEVISAALMNANFSHLVDGVSAVEGAVSTLSTSVSDVESAVTTIEGSVSTLQGSVSTLQGSVSTLQGNVTTLQGNVTTLQGSVTTLQGNVTGLQSSVNGLETSVASVESSLTTVSSRVSTLETSVSNIEGDVSAVESDVSDLQTALANLDWTDLPTRTLRTALPLWGLGAQGGATVGGGAFGNSGVTLPGVGTPSVDGSFVVPDSFTGTNIQLEIIWRTPDTNCQVDLRGNYIDRGRVGVGSGSGSATGGLSGPTPSIMAPSGANVAGSTKFTIAGAGNHPGVLPGDVINFGLYRATSSAADTCPTNFRIIGMSILWDGR